MMYFEMQLRLMRGGSEADPDPWLETSADYFLERLQHHHRLTAVVHLALALPILSDNPIIKFQL